MPGATLACLVLCAPGATSKTNHSLSLLSSLLFINAVKKLCTGMLLCCLGLTHISAANRCERVSAHPLLPGETLAQLPVLPGCREMGLQMLGNELLLERFSPIPPQSTEVPKMASLKCICYRSTNWGRGGRRATEHRRTVLLSASKGKAAASLLLARSVLWSQSPFQAIHLQPCR